MQRGSTPPRGCAHRKLRHNAAALLLGIALALPALSAVPAAPWAEAEFNPSPARDDIVLPMPCGGAMAFRKVEIPSEGALSDRLITVGETDDERGYAEGARPAYIAGSFGGSGDTRYYLLGKYEVSQLQYQALAPSCPQPTPDLRLAQADIGWFDAVDFADRYTSWLQKTAADKLPKAEGEFGYARLPTEVEWEFAARGGIAVSPSQFSERIFPMTDGGLAAYVWFAGPASSNTKLQRIGLLKANPLGLHDILGNVDEMTFEPFRLNKLDRLHGQAGGFVVRGGNFTTAEADVRTAYRHEVPYYRGGEPRRARTTGFRLAIVAPVITSRERLQAIANEWALLGTTASRPQPPPSPTLGETPLADPIEELGAIAAAAADANMQKRLKNLQLAFRASFQARDEQRDRSAKARLRLGTFLCQKLKDDGIPIDRLKDVYQACVAARGAEHERCTGQKTIIEQEEAKQYENLRYYADTIVTLTGDYDAAVVDQQAKVLKSEIAAVGLPALIPVADLYVKHAAAYRQDKAINRSQWLAECKKGG